MTVKEFILMEDILLDKDKLPEIYVMKKAFIYCNDCNYDFNEKNINKLLQGDPTETALIKGFFKEYKDIKRFYSKVKRIYEIPFDSTRKMMSVIS